MRSDTLLAYVRAIPFRPFRLILNSGTVYEVKHPEMVKVGKDVFNYYYATAPDAPFDHWDTVGLLLIERIEHLEPATAKS